MNKNQAKIRQMNEKNIITARENQKVFFSFV